MALTWDQALVSIAKRNNHKLPSGGHSLGFFRPDGSAAVGASKASSARADSRTERGEQR